MNKEQIIAKLIQLQGEVEDLASLLEDEECEQGDEIHSVIGELWDIGLSFDQAIDLLGGENTNRGPDAGVPYILTV